MIKVSVIIPVYNAQRYLEECLKSVFSQTLEEIEVICIDDGSTDESYNILKRYGKKYSNLIVLQQRNLGAGSARNRGIVCAKGEFVCFMDSDDYYAGNHVLEMLYKKAIDNNVLICGGNIIWVRENGETGRKQNRFCEDKKWKFEEYGDFYYYTCFIINRKMLLDNKIMFPLCRRFQDPPFLLNAMGCAKEFYAIKEVVYIYRVGHKQTRYDSDTVCDVLRGIKDCYEIAQKYNFIITYNNYLKNIFYDYFPIIYPYAAKKEKEVWTIIKQIDEISLEWMGEVSEIFADFRCMATFVDTLKKDRAMLIEACMKAEEIVIYGAGKAGKCLLGILEDAGVIISGFAVSRKDTNDTIEEYSVKVIGEYDRDALVIVAISRFYVQEMMKNLKQLGFKNILCVTYEDLKIWDCLKE